MPEPQGSQEMPKAGNGTTFDTQATAEGIRRQGEKAARSTERVIKETAAATEAATQAQSEILQRNVEAAQGALQASVDAGAATLRTWTETVTRALGMATPDGDTAKQSAENVRVVSQASASLARGAQEASRAWLDLVQGGLRSNLEAAGEFTRCRSYPDLVALQSKVTRQNLERLIDQGQLIAQASMNAISEARQAIQGFAQPS